MLDTQNHTICTCGFSDKISMGVQMLCFCVSNMFYWDWIYYMQREKGETMGYYI